MHEQRKRLWSQPFKTVVSLTICMALILSQQSMIPLYAKETGAPFVGFNANTVGMSGENFWTLRNVSTEDGAFVIEGTEGEAVYYINLNPIAEAIDHGALLITLSVDAKVSAEAGTPDEATASLYFSDTDSFSETPDKSISREIDNLGEAVSLTSSVLIPRGTRYVQLSLLGASNNDTNTVVFSNPSLIIHEDSNPTITASISPEGWTNGQVSVTVTGADEESGVEGIYDGDTKVSADGSGEYTYDITENGTRSFYAKDFADHVSDIYEVKITTIDKDTPPVPSVTLSNEGWSNATVSASISGSAPAEGQSPQTEQYSLGGGEWQDYSGAVSVSAEGETVIRARTIDEAGNISSESSKTAYIDQTAPEITVHAADAGTPNRSNVTFTAQDGLSGVLEKRWVQGAQDADFFKTNGTVLLDDTFEVDSGAVYTVYAMDNAGNAAIEVVAVNGYPGISAIDDQLLDENARRDITFTVSDAETPAGEITVSATSSNTAVLPDPVCSNDNGIITLTLAPVYGAHGGPITVTVNAQDADSKVAVRTFTVTVQSVNDLPQAVDDTALIDEDTSATVSVLANDTDGDGDALSIKSFSQGAHGVVSQSGSSLIYTPAPNFNGEDTFTYVATDGTADSTGTVTITVTEINDNPKATNDSIPLVEDEIRLLDVLLNDADNDIGTTPDEALIITQLGTLDAARGTIAIVKDAGRDKVRYTPPENWSGSLSFTYTISDRRGITSTATVSITVDAFNDSPVFTNLLSEYTLDEDSGEYAIHFTIADVETPTSALMLQASGDSEALIPASSFKFEGLGDTDAAATFKFTPAPNANGEVIITFRLSDGFKVTTLPVTIHITPVNDVPVANDDTLAYEEDKPLTIDLSSLTSNDTDIDHDPLTVSEIVQGPAVGTLEQVGGSIYRYTPVPDDNGNVTFVYRVSDGQGGFDTATVTLTGKAVNDAPTITLTPGNNYTTEEDTALSGIAFTVKDNETPAPNLIITAGSQDPEKVSPEKITVTKGADGACTLDIVPNENANGGVEITLTVSDGVLLATQTFTMHITPVPDDPTAVNDTVYAARNAQTVIEVLANDYDVDGETVTIAGFTQGEKGSVSRQGDTLVYLSNAPGSFEDRFTYTISDGYGGSATATVSVAVGGYSFPPSITGVANQFINEDNQTQSLPFAVADRDTGDTLTVTASSSNTTLVPNNSTNLVVQQVEGGNYTVKVIPAPDAYGSTIITLAVSDGGKTTTTTFTVTVYPVNDEPVAETDTVSINEDTPAEIDVLANDSDLETPHADLRILSVTAPQHGRIVTANGKITYTPYSNSNEADTFTYTLTDGETSVQGTVNITIVAVNDAPYYPSHLNGIWHTLPNQVGQSVTFNGLANWADVENDTLYLNDYIYEGTYGTVTFAGGDITYTRTKVSPNANGADTFQFRVRDRETESSEDVQRSAYITVHIGEVFTGSMGGYDSEATIDEDAPSVTIPLYFSGEDGDVTIVADVTPSLGQVTAIDKGKKQITYQPDLNQNGIDRFSFKVTDESSKQVELHVTVTIRPVNDPPEFTVVPSAQTLVEDTASDELTVSFTDPDNDPLTFIAYPRNEDPNAPVLLTNGIKITREVGSNTAQMVLTPVPNASGDATVVLQASDGIVVAERTFSVKVSPDNDPPVANDYTFEIEEDAPGEFAVLWPGSDPDGAPDEQPLTVSIEGEGPNHGTASVNPDGAITYIPAPNYNGQDSFTYKLDDRDKSDTGTVTVDVQAKNDKPVITGLASLYTLAEDGRLTVSFTVTDADGEPVTTTLAYSTLDTDPFPAGSLAVAGTDSARTIAVNPAANKYGTVDVTLTASDGTEQVTQHFTINVYSVNDTPTAEDDHFSSAEDTPAEFAVLTNDKDVEDLNDVHIVEVSTSEHGGTVVNNGGTLTYNPPKDYFGEDSFTYTIIDKNDAKDRATVTVLVTPVNDLPAVQNESLTTNEDETIKNIFVLTNDSDVEDSKDELTVILPSTITAKGGMVSLSDNTVTYQPRENYNGTDGFTYIVKDTNDGEATGTVTITVRPMNDAPDITNDVVENGGNWVLDEDTTGNFNFSVDDAESNATNLIVVLTSSDQNLIPDTSIGLSGAAKQKTAQITPLPNKSGTCIITAEVGDGDKTSSHAFTVIVNAINDQPTITASDISTDEDTAVSGKATGSDVEGAELAFSPAQQAAHGTAVIASDGSYTYTPIANFNGQDSFTVLVDDGSGAANATSQKVVQVTVRPVNDAPVANNDVIATNEDTAVDIDVLDNLDGKDTDVDTDPDLNKNPSAEKLTILSNGFTGVEHGTVSIVDGKVRFVPDKDWNGVETFTYTITDVSGVRDTAQVTVTVNAVNDGPANGNDVLNTNEDTSLPIAVSALLANDDVDTITNPAAETLTFNDIVEGFGPSHGTAVVSEGDQTITYTPAANYYGDDSFKYSMHDAENKAGVFTVTIHVASVNDIPTITEIEDKEIFEDRSTPPLSFTVGDVETAKSGLTVTKSSSNVRAIPENGIVITGPDDDGNCTVIATPPLDWNGDSDITLTVDDGDGGTQSITFHVKVIAVNDRPTPQDDSFTTDENHTIEMNVLANDDVDLLHEGDEVLHIVSVDTQAVNGSVAITSGGKKLTFDPDKNWPNSEPFTQTLFYTVEDGDETPVDTGRVTITINPINDAPVISEIAPFTFNEDEGAANPAIPFTVTDEEDDDENVTVTASSSNPSLISNSDIVIEHPEGGEASDRTILITSQKDQNGEAIITLIATDNDGEYTTTTFTVTVNPVNDDPVGVKDVYDDVVEDTPKVLDVLENDDVDSGTNPTIESLTITGIPRQPLHGEAQIAGDGKTVTYTPARDYNGSDNFSYSMQDGSGRTANGEVEITVTPVNDAPVITSTISQQTVAERSPSRPGLTFTVSDVDDEADSLTVTADSTNKKILSVTPGAANEIVLGGEGENRTVSFTSGVWNGQTDVTLTVKDPSLAQDQATFRVVVTSVNDAPVAVADTLSATEDTVATLDVLHNDTDEDFDTNESGGGDELFITSVSPAEHATVSVATDRKTLTFKADGNWNGTTAFSYTIEDREGATSGAAVTVAVRAANDAPIAVNDETDTNEDTPVTINALLNDTDIDTNELLNNDPSALPSDETKALVDPSGIAGVDHGSATVVDGMVVFTPQPNWNGIETFTYQVKDRAGATATGSIMVTVHAQNDRPVAVNDTASTPEDTAVSIDVLVNDTDVDTDTTLNKDYNPSSENKTIVGDGFAGVERGTVAVEDGKVVFTPQPNWNGVESFTYTMRDAAGEVSLPAAVTVTVGAVNDTPVATDDLKSTDEDTPVTIDVLANDTDIDSDDTLNAHPETSAKSIVEDGFSEVQHGAVELDFGKVVFTPDENWNGVTTFTYTMKDEGNKTATAQVTVTVNAVNDKPVANNDTGSADEGQAVIVNALANDRDVDTDESLNADPAYDPSDEHLAVVPDGFAGVEHGTVSVNGDGNVVFTPNPNWNGAETFNYTIRDTAGLVSDPAEITVQVGAVNNAPVAVADSKSTDEDAPVTIDVLDNDTDVDLSEGNTGDELTIVSVSDVSNGSVAIASDGKTLIFTPAPDFNGTEEFKYTIEDTGHAQSTAAVTVTVVPVNDAPVAVDDSTSVDEDHIAAINVLANDSDVDTSHEGDTLTIVSTTTAPNGTVAIAENKQYLTFTPNNNWSGTATFDYTIEDAHRATATATVTVTVTPLNDAPTPPELLTPTSGAKFKDGQTVPVTWLPATDPENDAIHYNLSFYNGTAWSVIAENLTETSYDHRLTDTGIATDKAQYKVEAIDSQASSQDAGDRFIVDNVPPQHVTARLATETGTIGDGVWTNSSIRFSLFGGTDLLPFTYSYRLSESDDWAALTEGQEVPFNDTGVYTVQYRAVDELGNTYTGGSSIRIDKVAPIAPQAVLTPTTRTTGSVTAAITLFDDPGGSGNATVTLPNRRHVPAAEFTSWKADQNGNYNFALADNAGNLTGFTITVNNIERKSSSSDSSEEPEPSSQPSSQVSSMASSWASSLPVSSAASSGPASSSSMVSGAGSSSGNSSGTNGNGGNKPDDEDNTTSLDSSLGGESSLPASSGGKTVTPSKNPIVAFIMSVAQVPEILSNIASLSARVVMEQQPAVRYSIYSGLILFFFLLLFFIFWRPVRVEYRGKKSNGREYRHVKRRFAHVPRKKKTLTLNITKHPRGVELFTAEVTFRRLFTRRMRERTVRIAFDDTTLHQSLVEKDQKGRWTATVKL